MTQTLRPAPRRLCLPATALALSAAVACAGPYYGTEGALAGAVEPGDSIVVLAAGDIAD
ncbi:MAG TPA: hypothetical protein VEQ60_31830 [Longimicrobium sp.]|nr:hypothetical protein [Longimicrobium sp.]